MRATTARLLAEGAGPFSPSELDTLTLTLKGYLQLLVPEVEQATAQTRPLGRLAPHEPGEPGRCTAVIRSFAVALHVADAGRPGSAHRRAGPGLPEWCSPRPAPTTSQVRATRGRTRSSYGGGLQPKQASAQARLSPGASPVPGTRPTVPSVCGRRRC
ncbi:DUF6415 family natural product biosynthesis protein [Streptomyces phaeochromogenes]